MSKSIRTRGKSNQQRVGSAGYSKILPPQLQSENDTDLFEDSPTGDPPQTSPIKDKEGASIHTDLLSERFNSIRKLTESQSNQSGLAPRRRRRSSTMGSEFESIKTISHTSVKLSKWQDWGVWFGTLKNRAEMLGIWDYIDPDGFDSVNDKVTLPKPVRKRDFLDPGQSSPMTAEQMVKYKLAMEEHDIDKEEVVHAYKAMLQIQQLFDTTVDPRYLKATINQDTMRKKIKTLANAVRPSNESMRQDLITRYELLKATPYGKEVQQYFDDWQALKIDDAGQLLAGTIFPQGDYDPCRELIMAMKPLYPMKAEMQQQALRTKGINVLLFDEIEEWRDNLRFERVEKFPKEKKASQSLNGDLHHESLTARHNIGTLCLELGIYDEAQAHLYNAFTGRKKVFGWLHPHTLMSARNLAAVEMELENDEIAEKILNKALKMARLYHPHDDDISFDIEETIALVAVGRGRLEQARQLLQDNHARSVACRGSDDSKTLQIAQTLAWVLEAEDDILQQQEVRAAPHEEKKHRKYLRCRANTC